MRALFIAFSCLLLSCSPREPEKTSGASRSALSWSSGPGAAAARYWHASIALTDGRVLVAGGMVTSGSAADAELFSPTTKTWSAAGTISVARYMPCGGRLPSGKVLLAGGEVSNVAQSVVDVYDPATNTWSTGPSLISAQGRCVMQRLPGGRLLVVGDGPTPEVFDETTNTWTQTGTLETTRQPAMTVLASGKLLACGGTGGGGAPKATCFLYDASSNTWSATGTMKQARIYTLLAPLPDGRALIAGGDYGTPLSSAELWDPVAGTWSSAPSMLTPRKQLAGGALPDGKVLAAYGNNSTAEVFDGTTNTWTAAADATIPRIYANSVTDTAGRIVFTGGMHATTFALITTAEVFTQGALAATCAADGDCASKHCVDGVCCDTACTATCSACNVGGKEGTCTALDGVAPRGGRSCAPFDKCVAGACVTSCASSGDCTSDRYCAAPSCLPKKKLASPCGTDAQCESGHCVDGVCCDTACTASCAACDVPGAFGTCSPITGQPRGGRASCSGAGVGTTCGEQCNGTDTTACHYPGTSVACGTDACADGVEVRAGTCTGAGACGVTKKSCGAFTCAGTTCKTTCSATADCAAGYYCRSGSCVAYEDLGAACTADDMCKTGHCVGGACCGSSSCPTGSTCASGRCTAGNGGACSFDDECLSGNCVDGVCCDSRCGGQCEACDVVGSKGTCVPVRGAPHGGRAACEGASDPDPCKAQSCDGAVRDRCAAFVAGPETVCAPASCKGDALTLENRCDGKGTCAAGPSSSCLPFACVGRACATTCTSDSECGAEFRCLAGACVARTSKCSDDGLSSIPTGGSARSCAPYRCLGFGECGVRCAGSSQCAPGAVCDLATATCVDPTGSADDSGGCSMSSSGRSSSVPFVLALLGMILWSRRSSLALSLLLLGCGRKETAPDPSLAPLRAHGSTAARLAQAKLPARAAGGFLAAGRLLPTRADGALSIGPSTVRPLDVRPSEGRVVEHAVVYPEVADDTDMMLLATPEVTEELRIVRGPRAPSTLRWSLAGRFAVEHGVVVGRDDAGKVVTRAEPIDAVDARGVRRLARIDVDQGTLVARFDFTGMTFPITVDPAWTTASAMTSERREHAAVRLVSGKVLICGGVQASTQLSTAELYDPATNTFTAVASMKKAHAAHAAVLLGDGTVLAGGGASSRTELYDPATDTWTDLGNLPTSFGSLVGLDDGRALAIGGCFNSLDVFDPTSKTWAAGTPMITARYQPLRTKLDDGRVLVFGGDSCGGGGQVTSAELYDPSTNTWSSAATPPSFGNPSSLLAIPGKKALLTGGVSPYNQANVYDANTNAWTAAANMANIHYWHSSTLLPNGRVLVMGGQNETKTEVWNPATDTWSPAGSMATWRIWYPTVSLGSGAVLLTGGLLGSGTLSSAELFTLIPDGGSCSFPGECRSGECVSGVCCNVACAGTCSACDVAGAVGTCTALTGDPHYARTCGGRFACNAGSCRSTCSADAHCVSDSYCNTSTGACLSKKALGQTCARAGECGSGTCVDGVCCDRACAGQCEACDVAGSEGTCSGVVGAPRGSRTACSGPGFGTACGPSCDGKDTSKCTLAPATTFCSATTCTAGSETHASFCDGAGACKDVPKSCGAYGCGTFTCKVSCATNADCAVGHYCKGTTCTRYEDLGVACSSSASCKTGSCVDGVCCATPACESGQTCAAPGHEGTCLARNGAACTSSAACGSGACVDGVCCDRACDGRCEACDVPGSKGTCLAVIGAPHGSRGACPSGTGVCDARVCDGKDGKTCAGFTDTKVECQAKRCSGSSFSRPARCDGKGTCGLPEVTSCAPYICDDDGCLGSCTTDGQCAEGFTCLAGLCESKRIHCSPDLLRSIAVDGSSKDCAPYVCGATGECLAACATSSDCAGGNVCTDKACTPVGSLAPDEGGGCAFGGGSTAAGWSLFALGLGLIARGSCRRRR